MNTRQSAAIFSLVAAAVLSSACGQFRSRSVADTNLEDAKQKMFTEPTQVLTPSSPAKADPYSIYHLGHAAFGVDAKIQSLSARVDVESTAGTETVELVGLLRTDGSASLLDLSPLPDGKNRLVGEALCVDVGVCKKIILNIYYNVAGKTLKKQFSSDELKVTPAEAPVVAPAPVVKNSKSPSLPDETEGDDEKPGDFVGAPRNEVLIGKLWPRSLTPTVPPLLAAVKPATPIAVPPAHPAVSPKAPAPAKKSPVAQGRFSRWKDEVLDYWRKKSAPPTKTAPVVVTKPVAKPPAAKTAPAPAHSAATLTQPSQVKPTAPLVVVAEKPVASPPAPPVIRRPLPVKPQPQPIAPVPAKPVAAPLPTPTPVPDVVVAEPTPASSFPFPPAVVASSDNELEQKIGVRETKLAPLINLRDGGEARGSYGPSVNPKSSIVNANLLPTIPGLVPILINANAHYGSGMLVSFLENAATYLFRQLGLTLFVGDMSLKNGGSYGASSAHHTHRNGLDADLAWLGIRRPLVDSALDRRGQMVENFDFEKTWSFLSLAAHQELIQDAQKTTAVSRIYMSHRVKDGFCAWAKDQKLLDDPFNSELMRLVRRQEGHVKHFHLSLKCSPHYPLCRNLAGPPPPGPGC